MNHYSILAIGYNRVDSMERLLNSLEQADYGDDSVTLIISIDNSGKSDVEDYAKKFNWTHGEKEIKVYKSRLGLKKHILTCGCYLKDYDAMAVFEDDIVVSPAFYQFMKQAVKMYKNDDNVAGISLYTNLWNSNAGYPFIPQPSQYDTYFMQLAQSWGQVWLKKQWFEFYNWYLQNSETIKEQDNIPQNVTGWSGKSWLKYHIKYCIDNNKYFVYPYQGLSTCFSEIGEHCYLQENTFQIPMLIDTNKIYYFAKFENKESVICYDAFFERQKLGSFLNISDGDLTVDLYGTKYSLSESKKFLLSSKKYDFEVVKSYARMMRPIELNIIFGIKGNDIHLYNTQRKLTNVNDNNSPTNEFIYYHRIHGHTRILNYLVKDKFYEKIKLIFYRLKDKYLYTR